MLVECTPHCSVCDGLKQLYCGSCVEALVLKRRVALIQIKTELALIRKETEQKIRNKSISETEAKVLMAKNRLAKIKASVEDLRLLASTARDDEAIVRARVDEQASDLSRQSSTARAEFVLRKSEAEKQFELFDRQCREHAQEITLEQHRLFSQLISIFALRKKRLSRPADPNEAGDPNAVYDIVLGYDAVPSLLKLKKLSPAALNSGLERAAWFVALVGIYGGVTLPYHIMLPGKRQPEIQIDEKPLRIGAGLQTIVRTDRPTFDLFCSQAAKLAVDAAFLTARLGFSGIDENAATRLGVIVAQISLCLSACLSNNTPLPLAKVIGLSVDTDSLAQKIAAPFISQAV